MSVRRLFKPLMIAVAACGTAGCATQLPWDLPDLYPSGSATSPYYYGGAYGYGSQYYRGGYYGDAYYPYYYHRGGVALPYPTYGYLPVYPGYSCWDRNRDGRCDRHHGGDDRGGGDDDAGNGGQPPSVGDRPRRDVGDRERGVKAPGTPRNVHTLRSVTPVVERGAGEGPKASAPTRMQPPPRPAPQVEPRRPVGTSAPAPRAPRGDAAPRAPRVPRDDVARGHPVR